MFFFVYRIYYRFLYFQTKNKKCIQADTYMFLFFHFLLFEKFLYNDFLDFFCESLIILIFILQISNLLYVDQPIGTGFSYSSDPRDIRHNEESISNDLYDFLLVCFFSSLLFFLGEPLVSFITIGFNVNLLNQIIAFLS